MSQRYVISKAVQITGDSYEASDGLKRVISAEVAVNADERDITIALREIERLAAIVEKVCPGCFVPFESFHTPDCPLANEDQLDKLRDEAIRNGMR